MLQITLCYITYDAKMSLGAMKRFKELSGRDMWQTLCEFLAEYSICAKENTTALEMMQRLYSVCDFETASYLFYSLIKEEKPEIEVEQIQDAMFRVGWRPTELDNKGQVWPLMMVKLATDVDGSFAELAQTEKKNSTASVQ